MEKTKNTYLVLKQRQQKEFNEFPMSFAFSSKQFDEGMRKLGLEPDAQDMVYTFGGTGGFYLKSDAPALREMLDRHDREMDEAIAADTKGEGFILDMFTYELANHEYCITWDTRPTLDALGLEPEDVENNPALAHGLKLARMKQAG